MMCQSEGVEDFLLDDVKIKIYVTKMIEDDENSEQVGKGILVTSSQNGGKELSHNKKSVKAHLFKCNYEGCFKKFPLKKNLNAHINIHTKGDTNNCKNCGKSFGYNSNKKRHEKKCKENSNLK